MADGIFNHDHSVQIRTSVAIKTPVIFCWVYGAGRNQGATRAYSHTPLHAICQQTIHQYFNFAFCFFNSTKHLCILNAYNLIR